MTNFDPESLKGKYVKFISYDGDIIDRFGRIVSYGLVDNKLMYKIEGNDGQIYNRATYTFGVIEMPDVDGMVLI